MNLKDFQNGGFFSETPLVLWILLATVLLVVISLFGRKNKDGDIEEQKVEKFFAGLGTEYEMFRDIVLPSQGGMSHIDFVVVSPYCIFVIDVREEEGVVFGDLNSQEWVIGKKDTIYNPAWRNRRNMNGLEDQIGKLEMQSVVIFTKARLKGDFGMDVVNLKGLANIINSRKVEIISQDRLVFARKILASLCKARVA
tara:strand:+ start:1149 stop:1739 length:591 start_codon:yes stop_codon:yes gene_type:complete